MKISRQIFFLLIIMNCLSFVKNISKDNYLLKSRMLFSKKMSSESHNYTLRVDIKSPSEAQAQTLKPLKSNMQKFSNDKTSKKITSEEISKPFGTGEYNYTLTSPSSLANNSNIKSKRI